MKYLQHFVSTRFRFPCLLLVLLLLGPTVFFQKTASAKISAVSSVRSNARPERQYRSWGGFPYLYKEKGVWKARAIFVDDDPDFFCGGGLKKRVLEKGVDLVPFTPKGCSQNSSKDAACFHLPKIFGDMNYHKAIFLDSRGNVFFETQGFPEGQCGNLMVIGQRFSRLEGDEHSDNWLYVPYHLYGTTSRGEYTGIRCP